METIHLICWEYDPSKAVFQRDWALAKGMAESGIKVEMDFVMPNNCKCANEPDGIHCYYWGNKNAKKGKLITFLLSIFKAILFINQDKSLSKEIKRRLESNRMILIKR